MKFVVILFLFLSSHCFSQTDTYEWETDFNYYEGKFHPAKYSYELISNTGEYLCCFGSYQFIGGRDYMWSIEELDTLKIETIDQLCTQRLYDLDHLIFPQDQFWKDLLEYRKKEVVTLCEYKKLFVKGYRDPSQLQNNPKIECTTVINQLNSSDSLLLRAWDELVENNKAYCSSQEEIQKLEDDYQEKRSSGNALKYARLELMSNDFRNCMKITIPNFEYALKMESEFQRFFYMYSVGYGKD